MYESITILGKEIGLYSVLAIIGLFLAGFCAYRLINRRMTFYFEDLAILMLIVTAGLFTGAHIMYGITHAEEIIKLFSYVGKIPLLDFLGVLFGQYFGGMVFYGGLFGCIIVLLIYTGRRRRGQRGIFFDAFAVSIPLFHMFGRIGCFMAGCCYGVPSHFGFIINGNVGNPEINGIRRFPVQLAESLLCFFIFLVLLNMYRKKMLEGKLIFMYFIIYGVVRFCTEFLRGDAIRGFIFGMSTSQFISIILIITGAVMLMMSKYRGKRSEEGDQEDGYLGQAV